MTRTSPVLVAAALIAAAYAAASLPAIAATPMPPRADAILAEINRARTDPAGYAQDLVIYRGWFDGKVVDEPGERTGLQTQEGTAAVDEAIGAMRRQAALPPLASDPVLARAAADHVREQGRDGLTGHQGRDGSDVAVRVRRRGLVPMAVGENISYGPRTAEAVVRELLVDDGVADRGHRRNLLSPLFARAGAACGPHKVYGTMCVIVFASGSQAPARRRPPPEGRAAPVQAASLRSTYCRMPPFRK